MRAPQTPPAKETLSTNEVRIRVASSELVVGPNRIFLGLHDSQNQPISNAEVQLWFRHGKGDQQEDSPTKATAIFLGQGITTAQALYSARTGFDMPGVWEVEASVKREAYAPVSSRTTFNVQARSFIPKIGDAAPPSMNWTLADRPIHQLTSQRPTGDLEFYESTIALALSKDKPLVIVFSTPAFCQTQTCGPQLEIAQNLKTSYGETVTFIHVDVFDRPDLLLEGETAPKVNPIITEWNLQTEPWVFIVDRAGKIHDRFEGFSSEGELDESIRRVLSN